MLDRPTRAAIHSFSLCRQELLRIYGGGPELVRNRIDLYEQEDAAAEQRRAAAEEEEEEEEEDAASEPEVATD